MDKAQERFRSLGRTGIDISAIGLGCWQFSKQKNLAGKFWPLLDDELIAKMVSLSLQGGINWFDTAEIYGNGASERSLAKALLASGVSPGQVVIATKWWPMFRFASNIGKTFPRRLEALHPFAVDLYQVHQPWGFSNERNEVAAMAELYQQKLIKGIGVSNFSSRQMLSAWETLQRKGIHLASNQVRYSLLDRRIESNGVLEAARKLGITIIAYSPLAQGLVTGKFHDHPNLIRNIGFRKYGPAFKPEGLRKSLPVITLVKELAEKYQVTPAQVALNWLIRFHSEMVVAIPGATREVHARENTGALSVNLSAEDLARLDLVSDSFK